MSDPQTWPEGVRPITVEQMEELGINARNELFWGGHRLVTRSHITLSGPQTLLAVLAALASLATVATGLNNASVFLCAREIGWLTCPKAAPAQHP